jgi:hypothetical protein
MDDFDTIWNRAVSMDFEPQLRGDNALQAVLRFHGLTMNGGVLHAMQQRDDSELDAIEAGYRWFGLNGVSTLIASTRIAINSGALDDDERGGILEQESDVRYNQLIPRDRALVEAVLPRIELNRSEFE